MGLFNGYLKEGKGVDKDAPKPIRPIFFFELFFRKFTKMIQLNLLFMCTTFPFWIIMYLLGNFIIANVSKDTEAFSNALTVFAQITANPLSLIALLLLCFLLGPSTAGATNVLMSFANELPVFLCSDYFENFKKNFKQASILMMFNVIAGLSTFITWFIPIVPGYAQNPAIVQLSNFRIPSLVVFLIIIVANFYAYSIMIKFDMKLMDIIKNSFLFTFARLPINILILVLVGAICYFAFANYLIGFLLLVLILYAFCGFLVVFSVYPTIEKYMLIPAQEIKKNSTTETEGETDEIKE